MRQNINLILNLLTKRKYPYQFYIFYLKNRPWKIDMKERRLLDYWMIEEPFILDEWRKRIVILFDQHGLIEYQATCEN